MKKIIYVLAAATLLLQACSSGKNSFSKKHYGHLRWIDHNTTVETPGKDQVEETPVSHEHKKTEAPATFAPQSDAVNNESPRTVRQEPVSRVNTGSERAINNSLPRQKTQQPATFQKKELSHAEFKRLSAQPVIVKKDQKMGAPVKPLMDDDAKLIICVILAIIIPPLGMYLWNNETDSWFIIDLILYILCFGAFFLFFGLGLAYLAAVVIALLRVFDQL